MGLDYELKMLLLNECIALVYSIKSVICSHEPFLKYYFGFFLPRKCQSIKSLTVRKSLWEKYV